MSDFIHIDDLIVRVIRSSSRNTLEIIIERDGELTLRIPEICSSEEASNFVKKKMHWIYAKLAQKELFQIPKGKKEIVNGEGFFFLGDSYRLVIVNEQSEPLTWDGENFYLSSDEVENGKERFEEWYILQAIEWLEDRVLSLQNRFSVEVSQVRVQNLGNRWGSCSSDGSINLHWRLILLPTKAIDYVLHHELAHVIHHNHSEEYWNTLEIALPDYRERKDWLAKHGGLFFL